MAMSRKNYEAIAAAIKIEVNIADAMVTKSVRMDAIRGVAVEISRVCFSDNPRFDTAKFLAACGVV